MKEGTRWEVLYTRCPGDGTARKVTASRRSCKYQGTLAFQSTYRFSVGYPQCPSKGQPAGVPPPRCAANQRYQTARRPNSEAFQEGPGPRLLSTPDPHSLGVIGVLWCHGEDTGLGGGAASFLAWSTTIAILKPKHPLLRLYHVCTM